MNPRDSATTLRVAVAIQGTDETRAPNVILAKPAPDSEALHRHLRERLNAGDVVLVDAGNHSAVAERIRELAVAGRRARDLVLPEIPTDTMRTFEIPPEYRERPPNRAMRRGNLHAGHMWSYPVKKRR